MLLNNAKGSYCFLSAIERRSYGEAIGYKGFAAKTGQ